MLKPSKIRLSPLWKVAVGAFAALALLSAAVGVGPFPAAREAAAAPGDAYAFVRTFGTYGSGDGQLYNPYGVAVDNQGYVYVTDYGNGRVEKFSTAGTFAGKWAGLSYPNGVAFDGTNVLVTDSTYVYRYTTAGTQQSSFSAGWFASPAGLATDASGNVYLAAASWDQIALYTPNGVLSRTIGSGAAGSGNGQFSYPHGVAVDAAANVYVADDANNRVQKFDAAGNYVTQWGGSGSGNGQFNAPYAVAVDTAGYVYVSDTGNNRVQKFTSSGTYVTQFGTYGLGDAQLYEPHGLAVDTAGNVYVADTTNNRVQVFSQSGGAASATATPTMTPTVTPTATASPTPTPTITPVLTGRVVGTGTSASCTESALATALASGGSITFNCGSAPTTITFTSAKTVSSTTSIDGANSVTLSGGGRTRLFEVPSGVSFSLANLTVRDANVADAAGGAILNAGMLTLSGTTFTNNVGLGGGAVRSYGSSSSLTATNSAFTGNSAITSMSAGDGGAISSNSGVVHITNCTFSSNTAYGGGAVRNYAGSQLTVAGSTFTGNTAGNSGGGLESSGALTVTGSTFTGNAANGSAAGGGGLTTSGPQATIDSTTFQSNTTKGDGGGVMTGGGTVAVTHSTFASNTAVGSGGGIENMFTTLTVDKSRFTGNQAGSGGAINTSNQLTVTNSVLSGNQATGSGGAIAHDAFGVRSVVSNSTVSGNQAGNSGGAFHNLAGSLFALNSTIANNSAQRGGAAAAGANLAFAYSTIAGNSASVGGGAIYNNAQFDVVFYGTMLSGNTLSGAAENCEGQTDSFGYNLDSDGTCKFAATGDLSKADTKLGPLQDNGGGLPTMALGASSPAIDHGVPAAPEPTFGLACPAADERGTARPKNRACDIGAYELDGTPDMPGYTSTVPVPTSGSPIQVSVPGGNGSTVMIPPDAAGSGNSLGANVNTATTPPSVVAKQATGLRSISVVLTDGTGSARQLGAGKSVTLTIDYSDLVASGTIAVDQESTLVVYEVSTDGTTKLLQATIDPVKHTATVTATGLSTFTLAQSTTRHLFIPSTQRNHV